MQTVARFWICEDAYLFRSYLGSEGIAAHVFDEYVPQNFWIYTLATGGIRVVVAPRDAGRAKEFFIEYERRAASGEPMVGDARAWPVALLATLVFGVPIMPFGRKAAPHKNGNP